MPAKSTRPRSTAAQNQNNNFRNIAIIAAVILGIGALGFLLYLNIQEPQALDDLRTFAGLPGPMMKL